LAFPLTWITPEGLECDESRIQGFASGLILDRSPDCFDPEIDMSYLSSETSLPAENDRINLEGPSGDPPAPMPSVSEAGDPLALITHPERALDAARRMEANCRNGLRFYSDFRRVRSLDEAPLGDDPFEVFDDGSYPVVPEFDPAFSRRA
jgi:hypothetical protein